MLLSFGLAPGRKAPGGTEGKAVAQTKEATGTSETAGKKANNVVPFAKIS